MPFLTVNASCAVPKRCEYFANLGTRIDSNMGITARRVGAITTQEVQACRYSFISGLMRKITKWSSKTATSFEEFPANGNLPMVVYVWTMRPRETLAYNKMVVSTAHICKL